MSRDQAGGPPRWAGQLSAGADPELVACCVALLVDPAADVNAQRRVLARRLDAGLPTDAASVAADLAGNQSRDPAFLDSSGRTDPAVGGTVQPDPGAGGSGGPDPAAPGDGAPDAAEKHTTAVSAGGPHEPAVLEASARALLDAGARVHVVGQPGYPARLADAWPELGAPLWLAVRSPTGRLPEGPAVAVVGTRRPSLDGLRTARALGRLLGRHGVTVVSGLARGIDQEAHRGALDAGGATVAVLGTGLDVDYPAKDGALRAAIADAGGLATELPLGAPPHPWHFLARNRIISGLAEATVVVEGRARSGALQTARMAASQGREVFAVPGSLHQPTARGPLDLVRDGARCLTRLEDVLEAVEQPAAPARTAENPDPAGSLDTGGPRALGTGAPGGLDTDASGSVDTGASEGLDADAPRSGPQAAAGLSAEALSVHGLLGAVPTTAGALADAAGLSVPAVMAAVSELLARGLAVRTARGVSRG